MDQMSFKSYKMVIQMRDWYKTFGMSDLGQIIFSFCSGPLTGLSNPYPQGAPGIISKVLNTKKLLEVLHEPDPVYFTDIQIIYTSSPELYYNPYDNVPNDDYLDYLVYADNDLVYDPYSCLSPEELNFYTFVGGPLFIEQFRPQGKEFINCFIWMNYDFCLCNPGYSMDINPSFGIKHLVPTGPIIP